MRILVADDDPVFLMLLESLLETTGHGIVLAHNGNEAWDAIETASDPLLAILDWEMPHPDGLELCQRIQSLPTSKLVYSILLTGRTGRDAVIRGLQAGAHDYITKPFDHQELNARLQTGLRVLQLQQTLAERVRELEIALQRVKQLQGLLPICSYCKSIRTDTDYWQQVEHYISEHSAVQFSHGICPDCFKSVVEPQLEAFRQQGLANPPEN